MCGGQPLVGDDVSLDLGWSQQSRYSGWPQPHFFESPKIQAIARGDHQAWGINQIRGNGYVVDSLTAALWCFWTTDTYADAILTATNLGDDADTTAAICGQLAGAYYGLGGIPHPWLEKLTWREQLLDLADQLYQAPTTMPKPAS